jgi:hypothetical protein
MISFEKIAQKFQLLDEYIEDAIAFLKLTMPQSIA